MFVRVEVNLRDISNAAEPSTIGLKIQKDMIDRIARTDEKLEAFLAELRAGVNAGRYSRELSVAWPIHTDETVTANASYTYTGRKLTGGGFSYQCHIAVSAAPMRALIERRLLQSRIAIYFRGGRTDLLVIGEP